MNWQYISLSNCHCAVYFADMLAELLRREELLNIKLDPYIDALVKVGKSVILNASMAFFSLHFMQKWGRSFTESMAFFLSGLDIGGAEGEYHHRLCS